MAMESRPGDPTSEHLHAVVVPNFEELKHRRIVNSKEVIRFDIEGLSAQLASTKRIGSYEIWQEDLPRTTTRKLKRFEIEKRVRANRGKTAAEPDIRSGQPLTEEEEAWLYDGADDGVPDGGEEGGQAGAEDGQLSYFCGGSNAGGGAEAAGG